MAGTGQTGHERPGADERAAARSQIRSMTKAGLLPTDQLGRRLAAARTAPDQATLSRTQDPGWVPEAAPASARGMVAALAAVGLLAAGGAAVFAALAPGDGQPESTAPPVLVVEGPLTTDSAAAALSEYLSAVSRGDWASAASLWCAGLRASHTAADLGDQVTATGGSLPAYRVGPAGEPAAGRALVPFHLRWADREDGPFEASLVEEGGEVRFCGAGPLGGPHRSPLVPEA
jgi:hypothetical protein